MTEYSKNWIDLKEFNTYQWVIRTRMFDLIWQKEKKIFQVMLFLGLIGLGILLLFNIYKNVLSEETIATIEMMGKIFAAVEIVTLAIVLLIKTNHRIQYFIKFNKKDMSNLFESVPDEIQYMISVLAVIREPLVDATRIRASELHSTMNVLSEVFKCSLDHSEENRTKLLNACLACIRKNDFEGFSECIVGELEILVERMPRGAK